MSSPVQARLAIESGRSLSGVPLRTWEFMNYYTFDYEPPKLNDVALSLELIPDPGSDGDTWILQIGVRSPDFTREGRRPMNLTFVVDTSGSMGGGPLKMGREVLNTIAGELRSGDVVSMVQWSDDQGILLSNREVDGPDDAILLDAIAGLTSGGGTDLSAGLTTGYKLAAANYSADRINRIVLISDGGANLGNTNANLIAEYAGSQDTDGIYMVGVGVGGNTGLYNDELMDQVTDIGKGAAVYIASEAEAQKMFGDRFLSTMDVWVRDVSVVLDLPAGFEIVKFSGEEYSADPAEIEPQHLAPNDAMVFYQTIRTCAPEAVDELTGLTVAATWKDGITFEAGSTSLSTTFGALLAADSPQLYKGAAIYEYAEGLKVIRGGGDRAAAREGMMTWLERAEATNPEDADLAEIRGLIEAL
jgi:Ca-activated chloride channel family protein